MQLALILVPLLALLVIATGAIKLSALILRYQVRWSHALLFAAVVVLLSFAAQGISARHGVAASFVGGVALELGLGGWLLGERGRRKSGEPIGWSGGLLLTVLAQLMLFAAGLALLWSLQFFREWTLPN